MNKQLKGSLQMTLTALIWGTAFVAQSVGMDYVGPWTFNCVRNVLGALVLIPVIYIFTKPGKDRKMTLIAGIISGIFLASASLFQQYGIKETAVGKAGFITALYIIMVPFLSIFMRKKIALIEWISAFIAVAGFYIMSIQGKVSINRGDILLLICAVLFSMQILCIDHFVDKVNPVAMSCIQFVVSAIISSFGMFFIERPTMGNIMSAALPIMYAGILSSGVAYTLQIIGQKNLEPTLASLLMSLESVFSALAGWIILKQIMSTKEIIGSLLVFTGVIIAQLPKPQKNILKTKNPED